MQPVLDQLHLLADIILLDTPPVLATPDTAILGSLTHGAVVVASEGKTDRVDLERTAHRLESTGCNVVGLVLNHVRHTVIGQLPGLQLQAMNPTATAPAPGPSDGGDPLVVVVAYHAPDLLDHCLTGWRTRSRRRGGQFLGRPGGGVAARHGADYRRSGSQPRLRRSASTSAAPGGRAVTSCCSTPTPS